MEYTFLECKQYVCAGRSTLLSISDRLDPSIFCRDMEKARPLRDEGRDGWRSYLFPARVGVFNFDAVIYKVLFPICTVIWLVNNYVSRQEKF